MMNTVVACDVSATKNEVFLYTKRKTIKRFTARTKEKHKQDTKITLLYKEIKNEDKPNSFHCMKTNKTSLYKKQQQINDDKIK